MEMPLQSLARLLVCLKHTQNTQLFRLTYQSVRLSGALMSLLGDLRVRWEAWSLETSWLSPSWLKRYVGPLVFQRSQFCSFLLLIFNKIFYKVFNNYLRWGYLWVSQSSEGRNHRTTFWNPFR